MKTPLAFALLLGSGSMMACTEGGTGPDDGVDAPAALDDGVAPIVASGPDPLATDGGYRIESTLVVEAGALLPATAYDALQTLAGLRDHPARTLFDLAEDAGVPAVGTIRDALPSVVASRIEGWIDDEIRGLTTGDGSLPLVIDTVLGIGHAEVGQVRLTSRLALDGATASHRLDTVELAVMDHALAYDVAPLAGVGVALEVSCAATITRDANGATIALGAHGFGLPYGRIAWRAMEDLMTARYGRDLRAVLGDQVDCPALAAAVAARCVFGQCVGHESDLRAICEAGLDRAVSELRSRALAATVEPIVLAAGVAHLVDGAPADGNASMIETGTWTARLDLGQGARPAPATFTGARE